MAKGNLFLGMGAGSVGDVTFWRANGEQLSRARVRKVGNPRTDAQLITRILLKTCSMAYSALMGDFAEQTFQGSKIGAENQRRFMSKNVRMLRDCINLGEQDESMNFAAKDTSYAPLNRYFVSEGNLQDPAVWVSGGYIDPQHNITAAVSDAPTYQEVCDGLGLPAGAQLTFIVLTQGSTPGTVGVKNLNRIILAPAGGDMSVPFISNGSVNDPNDKNRYTNMGPVSFSEGHLHFSAQGTILAVACVASYYDGSKWQYSTTQLWMPQEASVLTLNAAIESWRTAAAESTEYTRQAEVPGAGGGGVDNNLHVTFVQIDSSGDEIGNVDVQVPIGGSYVRSTWANGTAKVCMYIDYIGDGLEYSLMTAVGLPELVGSSVDELDNGLEMIINPSGSRAWPDEGSGPFSVMYDDVFLAMFQLNIPL